MTALLNIRPKKNAPKPVQKRAARGLEDAPGFSVDEGRAIEWGGTSGKVTITPADIAAIKRHTGCKEVDMVKAMAIKSLMASKSCAQIVRYFRKRKGYGERTVKGLHAALSKAAIGEN